MDKYIGTKLIEAKEMNLGEYNNYRGWEIPENEDLERKGYLVKYEDGYVSWSPKEIFESAYKQIHGKSKEVEYDLITQDNTYLLHDENVFNAPHNYTIHNSHNDELLCGIHFQEGPIKENKLNGIFMEDLIAICINRLENFQDSEFRCRENAVAITKLEESLMWLRKRTLNRQKRNVQGTSEV